MNSELPRRGRDDAKETESHRAALMGVGMRHAGPPAARSHAARGTSALGLREPLSRFQTF